MMSGLHLRIVARYPFLVATCLCVATLGPGQSGVAADAAVQAAIDRGAVWLRQRQQRDGAWNGRGHQVGETALAGLALLAAGDRPDSPPIVAASRVVRRLVAVENSTYDVSLAVMFLNQLSERMDSELIRALGQRLVRGQCADGSWTYSVDARASSGDNSNAQFGVLACWICRRHGAEVDRAILAADRYFRTSVNQANGGWGYSPREVSTPSMTCAGLVALAAERGASVQRIGRTAGRREGQGVQADGPPRDRVPAVKDPVVERALAYLGNLMRTDQIAQNSKPWTGLYFYWSLERVGVIYGLASIGGVDWYSWGSARILPLQKLDGSWGGPDCVDTSFAILFLTKANVAADLSQALGGWQKGDVDGEPPGNGGFLRVERSPRRNGSNGVNDPAGERPSGDEAAAE
jgi:hypothetical protein